MRRIYEANAYTNDPRSECFWPLPDANWQTVAGEVTTEFAIIGGGYTGLSAALHLAENGVQVLVLEAESPGWGASGRNGGFCCLGGAKLGDTAMTRRFGNDAMRQYWQAEIDAVQLVAQLLKTHNIDADTHSNGEVQLAHRPRAMASLRAEAETLASHGIQSDLLSQSDLKAQGLNGPGFYGGLHVPVGFALNPAKYAQGLANAATKAGADIRAHSKVTGITREYGRFKLTTANGQVTAKHLIVATNGYSSEDIPNWLRARYLPVQSNIMVTRALSVAEQNAQGWTSDLMAYDSRHLLHYFRLLPDGRFLFGMRGGVRADARAQTRMKAALRRDFDRMFPAWTQVETTHFWSGLACLSRDLTPFAGPIKGWDNAWAGLAYHGNGVAMGTYTGARLAALALGHEAPSPVFSAPLRRFPLGKARRALLHAAYGYYKFLDGR